MALRLAQCVLTRSVTKLSITPHTYARALLVLPSQQQQLQLLGTRTYAKQRLKKDGPKKKEKKRGGNVRQVEDEDEEAATPTPTETTTSDANSTPTTPTPTPTPTSGKGKKASKKEAANLEATKKSDNVLEDTIRQIEQSFGKGALMKLSSKQYSPAEVGEVVSTGSLGLDVALGAGGLPVGRITEIYGPESSGKTTLALHVIAEAQKLGKYCAFIDAEHALNPRWAATLGVKTEDLLISQPDSGEQALEIVDSLIKAGNTNVIVIDSVAALVPKVELEGEMGDTHIGVQARLMSQALRKISPSITKSKCVLIFINQIRMKIGVMFGNPETTTGGNALKFYSSVRLEIRRIGSVKRGEEIIGNQIRVKVAKNKLAPPFREALFDIDFGKGISRMGEVIDWGVKSRVLEKMGAWYAYNGIQIGQGREKTKAFLETNPEVAAEIEKAIRDRLLHGGADADVQAEADVELVAEGAETGEKSDKRDTE